MCAVYQRCRQSGVHEDGVGSVKPVLTQSAVIIPKVLPPSEPGVYELATDELGEDWIPAKPKDIEADGHYGGNRRVVVLS